MCHVMLYVELFFHRCFYLVLVTLNGVRQLTSLMYSFADISVNICVNIYVYSTFTVDGHYSDVRLLHY